MDRVTRFRELHQGPGVLLMPNAWDIGSARILVDLGFPALATTSGGAAAARGLLDGALDPGAVLAHCAEIAGAVDVPVSGDLEDCFADDPAGVAAVVRRAHEAGLAGVSIEDWDGSSVRPLAHAVERVAAAVEGAAGAVVVTARAENHFRGVDDLDDTVRRLRAYEDAGADVVYAPGLHTAEQLRTVLAAVTAPLNVLAVPGTPPVAELAGLGVRRVSVGAAFAFGAYASLADAAGELAGAGTYGWLDDAGRGRALVRRAFAGDDRPG